MAINPDDITTAQLSELPPNPISLTDNFAHEVGDQLSRATIQELVTFIRAQSVSYPYELKIVRAPNVDYINDNFDTSASPAQGLGKVDGLWSGWAICNGNNGTDNLDGQALIGYGANYATVGQFLGEKEHTLSINEIPIISPINGSGLQKGGTFGGSTGLTIGDTGTGDFAPGQLIKPFGGGLAHNNLQPSMVVLILMKLP